MTNQIHQWAHMPSPPAAARTLQKAGLLLRPGEHAGHNRGPYDTQYCITTGWCNRPLEALRFFQRLENAVTRLSGLVPRADERSLAARARRRHRPVVQDV